MCAPAFFYGGITGLFIATYTVVDGYAVKVALMSPILVGFFGNLLRLVFLTPTLLHDRSAVWALFLQQRRDALIVDLFRSVSYLMVLYALQVAPLSRVAPAREVSMLFAALLGGHLLGEKGRGPRIAGAVLIAAGVMALGLD